MDSRYRRISSGYKTFVSSQVLPIFSSPPSTPTSTPNSSNSQNFTARQNPGSITPGKLIYSKMSSSTVDREVLEAAQTLCMLAMGNRPRQDKAREDDDCIITHVRPVAHVKDDETEDEDVAIITQARRVDYRYHPYQRPQARPVVDRSRVLPDRDADGEWMEISGCALPSLPQGLRRPIPVQGTASFLQRPVHFQSPAPFYQSPVPFHLGPTLPQRPVPDPRSAPFQSPAQFQSPAPFQQGVSPFQSPAPFQHGISPFQRPAHFQSPALFQSPAPFHQGPVHPHQGPANFRKPLPSQKSAPVESPGPVQGPHSGPGISTNSKASEYSISALGLQAILSVGEDFWPSIPQIGGYLRRKYPELREEGPHKNLLTGSLCGALKILMDRGVLERYKEGRVNRWRVVPGARVEAINLAWTEKADCQIKRSSSRWGKAE